MKTVITKSEIYLCVASFCPEIIVITVSNVTSPLAVSVKLGRHASLALKYPVGIEPIGSGT